MAKVGACKEMPDDFVTNEALRVHGKIMGRTDRAFGLAQDLTAKNLGLDKDSTENEKFWITKGYVHGYNGLARMV